MRTHIASAVVGVLVAQSLTVYAPALGAVPGDVDGDAQVTANDARLAVKISGGLFKALAPNVTNGDVASSTGNTPDGRITLVDAVRILRAVNGLDNLGGSAPGSSAVPLRDPNVVIPSNLVRNYTLPGGFKLSGTAKTTLGQSITIDPGIFSRTTGSLSFVNILNSASASAATGTGAYSTVLAAGSYNVKVMSSVLDIDFQTGAFSNYTVAQTATPSTVGISADKTQNFVRPDLPVLGNIDGTITGADVIPQLVTFTLNSGGGSGFGQVDTDAFTIAAPPGLGYLSVQSEYAADTNVTVAEYLLSSPVTVVSGGTVTRNVAVPALGAIHGTITTPAGTSVEFVSAGNYVPGQSTTTNQFTSSYLVQTTSPNTYRLALPAGTYPVTIGLAQITAPTSNMMVSYLTEAIFGTGDTLKNYTLPALPAILTFNGVVKGPTGAVLSGANLMLISHATTGYSTFAQGNTNAAGAFTIALLPGTYDITISPP